MELAQTDSIVGWKSFEVESNEKNVECNSQNGQLSERVEEWKT